MAYNVTLKKSAIKALEKINELTIPISRKPFTALPITQDPKATKN